MLCYARLSGRTTVTVALLALVAFNVYTYKLQAGCELRFSRDIMFMPLMFMLFILFPFDVFAFVFIT